MVNKVTVNDMSDSESKNKIQEDWPPEFAFGTEYLDFQPPPLTANMAANGLRWERAANIVPDSVKWLWPNRIPRGKVSLIAGFPNQGKSQLLCSIAATITTGGAWPNGEGECEKGAVMFLGAEDTAKDTLVPRLIAAGADLDYINIVKSVVTVDGRRQDQNARLRYFGRP